MRLIGLFVILAKGKLSQGVLTLRLNSLVHDIKRPLRKVIYKQFWCLCS